MDFIEIKEMIDEETNILPHKIGLCALAIHNDYEEGEGRVSPEDAITLALMEYGIKPEECDEEFRDIVRLYLCLHVLAGGLTEEQIDEEWEEYQKKG